jgi:pyridoxamine 5'-phosphate oxidase
MTADLSNLDDVLDNSWFLLARGVADRRHGFHHGAVANIGLNGLPRIRTVILRAVDRATNSLRFHTDIRSQKCRDLRNNPNVSFVFYDEASKTQLRVEGEAKLHNGDDIAKISWAAAQPMSRLTYGIMPEPGLAIDTPDIVSNPAPQSNVDWAEKNFTVVLIEIRTMQWLYLRQGGQRCAVFDLASGNKQWHVPS